MCGLMLGAAQGSWSTLQGPSWSGYAFLPFKLSGCRCRAGRDLVLTEKLVV